MSGITFRLTDEGQVVAEGCHRDSPLAMLLEIDLDSDPEEIDRVLVTLSSVESRQRASAERDYLLTQLRLADGSATVRVKTAAANAHERADTLELAVFRELLVALRRLLSDRATFALPRRPRRIKLYIREEFGFAHWMAELTSTEYRDLIRRWETIRGVGCLVPVDLIVPQATRLDRGDLNQLQFDATSHIHECSDSYLDGSASRIPESADGRFWIDGKAHDGYRSGLDSRISVIQVSKTVPVTELEIALAELLPGVKVIVSTDERGLPLDAPTVAVLTEENDPEWPLSLVFPVFHSDGQLGKHPHLTIARHLSERLSAKTLTGSTGLFTPLDRRGNPYWGVVCMEGGWFLAAVESADDGRDVVRIIGKFESPQ